MSPVWLKRVLIACILVLCVHIASLHYKNAQCKGSRSPTLKDALKGGDAASPSFTKGASALTGASLDHVGATWTGGVPQGIDFGEDQMKLLYAYVNLAPPKNLLVFGVWGAQGSAVLSRVVNPRGRTVFLHDTDTFSTDLELFRVSYKTKISSAFHRYKDASLWPELKLDLPSEVQSTQWHVILIDAPNGCCPNTPIADTHTPGRFQSIYMAKQLARPGSVVLLDDCERDTERDYGLAMLGEQNLVRQVVREGRAGGGGGGLLCVFEMGDKREGAYTL